MFIPTQQRSVDHSVYWRRRRAYAVCPTSSVAVPVMFVGKVFQSPVVSN